MNLFEVIGPVMVGPSSSHTAGAVRIGKVALRLLGEPVRNANIGLHGSFAATGRGHGTDRAVVAGLLGMQADDIRIPQSFEIALQVGLHFEIHDIDLGPDAHPNSVRMVLEGIHGRSLMITGASIGGGRISIREIDGLKTDFSADYPTLIVQNADVPGHIAKVTGLLSASGINVAYMSLTREKRGGYAAMILETDQEIPAEVRKKIHDLPGTVKEIYYSLSEREGEDVSVA